MNRVIASLVALVWSLWLGGLVTLFVALGSIFTTLKADRQTAGKVAAGLFHQFEPYQLGLAAAALLLTFLWRILPGGGAPRLKTSLFAMFAVSTLLAVILTRAITPQMHILREQGKSDGPEFDKLHVLSTRLYMADAGALLIGGFLLVPAIARDGRKTTGEEKKV